MFYLKVNSKETGGKNCQASECSYFYLLRTALAEAELEYNNEHISKSVFVKFPVVSLRDQFKAALGKFKWFLCREFHYAGILIIGKE